MRKTDEEIFLENCGPEQLNTLALCSFVFLIPLNILFGMAAFAIFKRRHIFHPVFSVVFIDLFLFYTASTGLLALRNITFYINQFSYQPDETASMFIVATERVYMILNFGIQPLIAVGLLERLAATVLSSKYEKSRYWFALSTAFLFFGIIVIIEYRARNEIQSSVSTRNIQTMLSIFVTIALGVLLIVNKHKTRESSGKTDLTERYQLAENVKTLRLFIPIVIIDTSIQIMFLITDLTLNVWQVLDLNYCFDDDYYLKKFLVFRVISFTIEHGIPCIIIYHFRIIKVCSRNHPTNPIDVKPFSDRIHKHITVRNVLGVVVSGNDNGQVGQETHFNTLTKQWK